MRTPRIAVVLALVTAAPAALAFEGSMDVKMTRVAAKGDGAADPAESGAGKIYLGKPGVRMQWQMGQGDKQMKMSTLMLRSQPDKVFFVNDANKTYSEMDTTKHQPHEDPEDADEKVTVKKLGNEKVAGYDCAHGLITTSKGEQVEVWASKDVGDLNEFMASQNSASTKERGWKKKYDALKSAGLSGWPMKWVDHRPDRDATMTWEVTRVEKGAPPASLFDLARYKKTEGFGAIQLSAEQQQQIDEAMKKMTPEQRQQLEKMMKGAK